MFKNIIKVALRNLVKQRIYSLINIAGLSVGIASCLLITLQVKDELSFDAFHEKADRIYKVVLERKYPDHVTKYAVVPHSFSDVIVQDFPEVESAVRIFGGGGNNIVRVKYINENQEEKAFDETRFIAADSTFFDIFGIRLLKGDVKTVLSKAQSMVITTSTAVRYFGDADPLNKTLQTDFGEYKITGICEDVPENSHMEFDFITSMSTIQFIMNNQNFTGFSTHMYLLLKPGVFPDRLESKFPKMVATYAAPQIEANLKTTFAEYTAAGNGYHYFLIPVKEIHLFPTEFQGELRAGGDINDVYILISIAILILAIAGINFMNLATARSTERAKEVGIRKTMGSQRSQLISQFLGESTILCFFSGSIAVLIVQLVLPSFNSLLGKNLSLSLQDPQVLLLLTCLVILVGILSGLYPAFALSSFNPVMVMKGGMSSGKNTSWLRNTLVVFQFSISIILIIGTLVVREQLSFINTKDMGYDRDNVLVIDRVNVLEQQLPTFIEELRKIPHVKEAGSSSFVPVNNYLGIFFQQPGASDVFTSNMMTADDEYIQTMGFEISKGRGFSKDYNDSLSAIINEQMAAFLKLDDPVGHKLINTEGDPSVTRELTIVGVVQDFHYMSLKEKISPFVILSREGGINSFTGSITSRIETARKEETITAIAGLWKKMVPQETFRYKFLDDDLRTLYKTEAETGEIFGIFSAIAIIIACVGLFGLAAYISGLRTKEIGIRKVLGASVGTVVLLLSRDFTRLIIIAVVLAIPAGWYFMTQWLNGFAYRATIGIWIFAAAGLSAVLIAWITVSYQSIRAAMANPVKSLRSE